MKFGAPKLFFPANIKFLRERRKMSQEALATKLGFTRAKLSAIENAHTRAPQPEDYIAFSEFFRISIDSLIRVELSKLGPWKLRELEAGNDVYMRGGNLRVLAISVDKEDNENVEYVPVKAKAGYMAGYSDPEFIATLPKYNLPNLPRQGTYRIFPITGDSMLPIPDGSDVTGQYLEDWKSIRPNTACVVLLKGQQDFVFKLVSLDEEEDRFLLRSMNPIYKPYTIHAEDILEIWKFHSYTSREIPEPETDIQQLTRMVRELKSEIRPKKEI